MNFELKTSTTNRQNIATAGAILLFATSSSNAVVANDWISSVKSHQFFPDDRTWKLYDDPKSGDKSIVLERKSSSPTKESDINIVTIPEKLDIIASGLGLNISDLEKVIGVKRATLYNWKKGGDIKDTNSILRLEEVFTIAQKVAHFNSNPLSKRAKNTPLEGRTYLGLLQEENLDEKLIVTHAKALAKMNKQGFTNVSKRSLELNDIQNITG